MDGSGYPQWTGRCGYGKNMTVNMDGNIAYVKFVSDGDNEWEGMRGFLAAFNAEGQLQFHLWSIKFKFIICCKT